MRRTIDTLPGCCKVQKGIAKAPGRANRRNRLAPGPAFIQPSKFLLGLINGATGRRMAPGGADAWISRTLREIHALWIEETAEIRRKIAQIYAGIGPAIAFSGSGLGSFETG